MKVWDGSAWVERPTKVWSGSAWVVKPVKYWDGVAWVVTPAGGGGPTQVRVTFMAPLSLTDGFAASRCSIGVQAATYVSPHDMGDTPVELTFSGGGHGFAEIMNSATVTSDWVNLAVSSMTGTVFSHAIEGDEGGWAGYGIKNVIPVTGGSVPVIVCIDVLPGAAVADNMGYSVGTAGMFNYYKNVHSSTEAVTSGMSGPYGAGGNVIQCVSMIETQ